MGGLLTVAPFAERLHIAKLEPFAAIANRYLVIDFAPEYCTPGLLAQLTKRIHLQLDEPDLSPLCIVAACYGAAAPIFVDVTRARRTGTATGEYSPAARTRTQSERRHRLTP